MTIVSSYNNVAKIVVSFNYLPSDKFDRKYDFIHRRFENDLSEIKFVARTHKNILLIPTFKYSESYPSALIHLYKS